MQRVELRLKLVSSDAMLQITMQISLSLDLDQEATLELSKLLS